MPDVVVVGAGPAGSLSAALMAKTRDVTVLEDHQCSGRPLQCTGLISPEALGMSGVRPPILGSYKRMVAHFPDGLTFSVDCKDVKAHLIDRSELDALLAARAVDAGADIVYSDRCVSCEITSSDVRVGTASGREYSAQVVVGADGHSSNVRRLVTSKPPQMVVRGLQLDLRHTCDDMSAIDVWLGSDVAPGFFAWCLPYGDHTRVGLCSEQGCMPPSTYLNTLLRKAGLSDSKIVSKSSGKIPLGLQRRTYGNRTLLIGDSACHVKPISGGGLFPIFNAAPFLADTVDRAFQRNDFSANTLSHYQKGWENAIGGELRNGFTLRTIYNRLTDEELSKIGAIIDRDSVREILSSASIDNPSAVVWGAMKNVHLAVRLLPYFFKGVLR